MIREPTVLILGAGSSMSYGFPNGEKLKAMIWDYLENPEPHVSALISCHDHELQTFRNLLLISPDFSIDYFLVYALCSFF